MITTTTTIILFYPRETPSGKKTGEKPRGEKKSKGKKVRARNGTGNKTARFITEPRLFVVRLVKKGVTYSPILDFYTAYALNRTRTHSALGNAR